MIIPEDLFDIQRSTGSVWQVDFLRALCNGIQTDNNSQQKPIRQMLIERDEWWHNGGIIIDRLQQ